MPEFYPGYQRSASGAPPKSSGVTFKLTHCPIMLPLFG